MQRLALGLSLLLFCGAVSAEQVKPAKVPAAALAAPANAAKNATAKAPATAPAAPADAAKKATAKAPKMPPAKVLFGAVTAPAPLAARAIGSYARGCLAGGISLPIVGPTGR